MTCSSSVPINALATTSGSISARTAPLVDRTAHAIDESAALRDAELFVQRFAVTGTRGGRGDECADEFRVGGFGDELAVLDQPGRRSARRSPVSGTANEPPRP